jgi:hypothetical protein
MLKQMYPGECDSQEGRDRKAENLPQEEFEMVFDAVLQRYRRARKRKQAANEESVQQTEEQEIIVSNE